MTCLDAGLCGTRRLYKHAQQLSDAFMHIMKAPFMRLRLDVLYNACSRFHTDAITARLICTYRGTGTNMGWQMLLGIRNDTRLQREQQRSARETLAY